MNAIVKINQSDLNELKRKLGFFKSLDNKVLPTFVAFVYGCTFFGSFFYYNLISKYQNNFQ